MLLKIVKQLSNHSIKLELVQLNWHDIASQIGGDSDSKNNNDEIRKNKIEQSEKGCVKE